MELLCSWFGIISVLACFLSWFVPALLFLVCMFRAVSKARNQGWPYPMYWYTYTHDVSVCISVLGNGPCIALYNGWKYTLALEAHIPISMYISHVRCVLVLIVYSSLQLMPKYAWYKQSPLCCYLAYFIMSNLLVSGCPKFLERRTRRWMSLSSRLLRQLPT